MRNIYTKILIIILLIAMIFSGCIYANHDYTPTPQTTTAKQTNQITPTITVKPTPTPEATFEIWENYVKQNGTRVYAQASKSSRIIGVLQCGEIVILLEKECDFSLIEYNNTKGYVKRDDLTAIPTEFTAVDLDSYEFQKPNIVIIKSLHILEIWDCGIFILSCSAQIGKNEDGDKEVLGDKKTPEGEYYLCTLNPGSKYYKGIYISYPNADDAKEAYENDTVNQSTMDRIIAAINKKSQPPYNTPLGGLISIHGKPNEEGYTSGCIAIDNEYMDIIWDNCPIGTQVTILP